MNRKKWLLLAAVALILGSIAFALVGIVQITKDDEVTEMADHGLLTFYSVEAGVDTTDGVQAYYILYQTEDGAYDYVRYDIGQQEYFEYQYDEEAGNPHKSLVLYVYTYQKKGVTHEIIRETALTVTELEQIIDNTGDISAVRYFLFAGVALACGIYIASISADRKQKKKKQ